MHSRIFQLGQEPIPPKDYINETYIPEWFTYNVADYVSDNTDRETDNHWLRECLSAILTPGKDPEKIVFTRDAKAIYFAPRYESFLEKAKELSAISLDDFIGLPSLGVEFLLHELTRAHNDKYGFYIYFEDELWTLDEWMRVANLSVPYYFGGTVDYHF